MNIFLDMDGVVANFHDGAIEAADLPLKHDDIKTWDFFKPYMTATQFWRRIHDTYEFWEGLEPYDWAQDLVDLCKQYGDVIFLSDSSHDDNAPSGKVKWLRRHGFLAPDSSNYMLGRQKHLLGYNDDVLIDDSKDNCKNWEGLSILLPQRWNTWQFDKVDRLSKVRAELGRAI